MSDQIPLDVFLRRNWRHFVQLLGRAAKNARFRRLYVLFTLTVLFGTTILWTILGTRLHIQNADQLSDPYMFSDWTTFRDASFPGSHTFLLKWPIFWLVSVFGVSSMSLTYATLAVVLLTVGIVVAILYKIDRRPLVFGTTCLALALALLMVPIQAYAGALLPVNMAMLTTRNLEYACYIVALIFIVRAPKLWSIKFGVGVMFLALLIASDKLFLSLSAVGALLALFVYTLRGNWTLCRLSLRWLVGSLGAAAIATVGLFGISFLHLTNLVNAGTASPYAVIHSLKNLLLGASYAVLGIFTNIGANPVYDNRILATLPESLASRMWSLAAIVYIIAFVAACYGIYMVWRVLWPTFQKAHPTEPPSSASLLAITLIWSTVAAIGVFMATDHYYAVDARYLTIGLFAIIVSVSVGLRSRTWRWPEDLLLIASALLIAIGGASVIAIRRQHSQAATLTTISARNASVNNMLKQYKVDVLVGDYWRVLPIKLASGGLQNVLPLAGCTQQSQVLTSKQWQPDLTKHSFAYLVTLDGSLTDFPDCSLEEITQKYGRPSSTQIVSGTASHPTEALLFYDNASTRSSIKVLSARQPVSSPSTISLGQLGDTGCAKSTSLNIVAHQDDDLLFMNPDIQQDIAAGNCIRTVFLTAGDAGYGGLYWRNRQLGSQAAYNTLLGKMDTWTEHTVAIAENQSITVATPQTNPRISLIYFNLPDGDLRGGGFGSTGYESLERLHKNEGSMIRSIDGRSAYNTEELRTALTLLMNTYQPSEIRTQGELPAEHYVDHSDHIYVGKFVDEALRTYYESVQLRHYFGYPIRELPVNVEGALLAKKEAAFLAYAAYDGGVCRTLAECAETPTYGSYIPRQYTQE